MLFIQFRSLEKITVGVKQIGFSSKQTHISRLNDLKKQNKQTQKKFAI